jgi:colanic acid biosynthesis glycosyl transferase WcaI
MRHEQTEPPISMRRPRYIFVKQTAPAHHFFRELCEDIAADDAAIVFSDMESHQSRQTLYIKGPDYDRTSAWSRARSWIRFLFSSLYRTLKVEGRPTVFIVTQPPLLSLLGYLQHKIRGRPYVLWIDDVWPDVLVRRGLRSEGSLVIRLWRVLNRITYRSAAHVITIGPYMQRTVQPYTRGDVPVSVVPTWVDSDSVRPIVKAKNAFAVRHGQTEKITVLYSGNMGVTHDMKSIVEAARSLTYRDDIHFMLIGGGAQFEWVRSSSSDLPNVTVLPLQPADIFPLSLATGDIALVCLERGIEGISMPSKTYASLAAGSAILGICARESDLAELIGDCECGTSVEPQNTQAIVDALLAMIDAPEVLARMRRNARTAVETRFSRAVCVAMVREILEQAEGVAVGQPA